MSTVFDNVQSGHSTSQIQRFLTTSEIAGFLFRHPLVAENVAQTKTAIIAGLYDWNYNPALEWRVPGTIAPWGMQVDDDTYGAVTIFPARNGEILFSGYTHSLPVINNPDYVSPPVPCKNGMTPVLGICPEDFQIPWTLIIGGILFYFIITSKKKG